MVVQRSYQLRVVEVIKETADAHSLVLEPEPADVEHFAAKPGQFLTFNIPTDRDGGAARCYSLASSHRAGEKLKVTVKRTAGGYGSNWICDNVAAGDTVEVLAPSGVFTPASLDLDFLLIAGGSGITPVMAILKSALHEGSGKVALLYANRDEHSVIFRDELIGLVAQHPQRLQVVHWLESVQGIPHSASLVEHLRAWNDRHVYICGPEAFMNGANQALETAGVPAERIHHEKFSTLGNNPFAEVEVELDTSGPTSVVEVQLDGQTRTLDWPRNAKLLDVLLDAGMDAPYSCREGNCSACACIVLEGEVEMVHNEVLEDQDIRDGITLGCQAIPLSDQVRVSYDD